MGSWWMRCITHEQSFFVAGQGYYDVCRLFFNNIPLFQGGFSRTVFLEGQDASDRRAGRLVQVNIVGAKYFDTFGIPLVRGRDFTDADQPTTPAAVIINETMAKRFWPDLDPIASAIH